MPNNNNNILQEFHEFLEKNQDGRKIAGEITEKEDITFDKLNRVAGTVVPAFTEIIKKNPEKARSIIEILQSSVDDPNSLINTKPGFNEGKVNTEGNKILQALFESKNNSTEVANKVSEKTGVNTDIVKTLLPILATISLRLIGDKLNQTGQTKSQLSQTQQGNSFQSIIQFLDVNKDGSVIDDIVNIASKFFGDRK